MANPKYPADIGGPTTRRSPLSINTSHIGALPQRAPGNRFSYLETPVEMQEPQIPIQTRYRPGDEAIRESPGTPQAHGQEIPAQYAGAAQQSVAASHGQQQQQYPQSSQHQQQYTAPAPAQPQYTLPPHQPQTYQTPVRPQSPPQQPTYDGRSTTSNNPYNIPEPSQMHPAYYAPTADPSTMSQPRSRPGSIPPPSQSPQPQPQAQPEPQVTRPQRVSTMPIRPDSDEKVPAQHPSSPTPQKTAFSPYSPTVLTSPNRASTQPIFAPTSLVGPNGLVPELHQPGQVPHPNMAMSTSTKGSWQHELCECNADVGTCMTGIFCPCILDSRTAYRLERRSSKKDPTDMLGFSSCNGRCGVMSLFGVCGLFCIFPLSLRTRIRHSYQLTGSIGSDILHSCCCCCCVAIQNEREVRAREEKIRQNAGPAAIARQYTAGAGEGMVYSPGAR